MCNCFPFFAGVGCYSAENFKSIQISGYSSDIYAENLVSKHASGRPYPCRFQCGKAFAHESDMKIHMRIHTGERLLQCPTCLKTFTKKCDLVRHTRTHTKERPFQCSVCDRTFTLKCNLKTHMIIHARERVL
ncbi:hypothetical protein CEXT_490371 [Caerostris extrusa]|uniref:C2H2-type domain-containing protein n=1 Tax=Caerostris extrusa TaxID=172846 RepID=A0AAV4PPJ5_CAEEX|nr:hypothetical protein CEXT_490371 [Caerostris extrusa]